MASSFTKLRDELQDDLQDQIARLSKEVAALRKSVSKRGVSAYGEARDSAAETYDELISRLSDAMPEIRRQSRVVHKAARDNPMTTAIVAAGVVGLLVSLFAARR